MHMIYDSTSFEINVVKVIIYISFINNKFDNFQISCKCTFVWLIIAYQFIKLKP